MAKYDPRPELIVMQQSLFEDYEHQLNQEIKENVAILSSLSQWEQARENMPCKEIQQVLE